MSFENQSTTNINMTQFELDIQLPEPVPVKREVSTSETPVDAEPMMIPKAVREALESGWDDGGSLEGNQLQRQESSAHSMHTEFEGDDGDALNDDALTRVI